ncbi:SLI1 (YGR212W) [Zygosaccharomyces parabailii]|uniref:ZYBA0S07-01002g1_1 n=1 Tax=Zygosaccharomyces bailii (strain CLIB 213 / ATCC 58445 / CBS 680 / BCRC 21525 / NBRC 1098 / NCYC 1416 / NRRL Y-2227) TaxID=1333698 RepID=A0A8J2T835_ZYGB2|nr:SLI1 (YGR212W) [Zygosaccharomyces parabailii]CDF90439.1 ZYBA0S07-01002g1_1 [Zygosaccharomyces bailii CLIB 213]CDH10798.1 related to N-acetyltransferase SLI1 [Zygosaccharomyces bailii ISA1307]
MGIRKLSSLEKFFYSRSVLRLHSCFYVGIQLDHLPEKSQLQEALKRTITEYTKLHSNVAIDDKDSEEFIKIIDRSFEFDDVVEYVPWKQFDQDKINYVFQNYGFSYNTEKPLWKILVLPHEQKLILLMSHVLFDGMAGVLIWKELLKNLNRIPSTIGTNSDEVYSPLESQHFDEDHHPYDDWPSTWTNALTRFFIGQYLKWQPLVKVVELNSDQFQFTNYSYPDGLIRNGKNSVTGCYEIRNDNLQWNLHLETQELQNILALCKKNQVSLTSMLVALLSLSITECADPQRYTGFQLKIDVPINTRLACNKILHDDQYTNKLGNFVANTALTQSVKEKQDIWQLAKKFQAAIAQKSQAEIHDAINECKLLDLLNIEQFLRAKIAAGKPASTFEVSNLGYQSFDDIEGPFQVKDAFFNQPQGIGSIFFCSVISTKGGFNCNITYPKDLEADLKPCLQYCSEWVRRESKKEGEIAWQN